MLYAAKIAIVGCFIHAKKSWSDLHCLACDGRPAGPPSPHGSLYPLRNSRDSEDCPGVGNFIGLGAGAEKVWKKLLHFLKWYLEGRALHAFV